jgi:hypothetical protein
MNITRKDTDIIIVLLCCLIMCILGALVFPVPNANGGTPKRIVKYNINSLADAIYWAEGGEDAKNPYGIKSVKCNEAVDCRKVCKNTIRNNRRRWKFINDESISYLRFLAGRYCPNKGDKTGLNKNWLPNVKYYLRNPKEIK